MIKEIKFGDAVNLKFTLTDPLTNAGINLTSKTVYFTVKENNDYALNDVNAIIQKTMTTHLTTLDGITQCSLTTTETALLSLTSLQESKEFKADVSYTDNLFHIVSSEQFTLISKWKVNQL